MNESRDLENGMACERILGISKSWGTTQRKQHVFQKKNKLLTPPPPKKKHTLQGTNICHPWEKEHHRLNHAG